MLDFWETPSRETHLVPILLIFFSFARTEFIYLVDPHIFKVIYKTITQANILSLYFFFLKWLYKIYVAYNVCNKETIYHEFRKSSNSDWAYIMTTNYITFHREEVLVTRELS